VEDTAATTSNLPREGVPNQNQMPLRKSRVEQAIGLPFVVELAVA